MTCSTDLAAGPRGAWARCLLVAALALSTVPARAQDGQPSAAAEGEAAEATGAADTGVPPPAAAEAATATDADAAQEGAKASSAEAPADQRADSDTSAQPAPPAGETTAAAPASRPAPTHSAEGAEAAPTPRAPTRLAIGVQMTQLWPRDDSLGLVAEKASSQTWGLWASYDLLHLEGDLTLAPVLVFAGSGARSTVRARVEAELRSYDILAGAQLQLTTFRWMRPHARVLVGATHNELVLSWNGDTEDEGTTRWGATVRGGIGVGFYLPRRDGRGQGLRHRLDIGVEAELGLLLTRDLDVTLGNTQLGTLGRSAPYLALSIVARH